MNALRRALAGLFLVATADVSAQDAERTVEMKVDGLVCGFCAQGIRKTFAAQASVEDVLVDLERGMVAIALRQGQEIDDETLRRSLESSGFALREVKRSSETFTDLRSRLEASDP